MKKILAFFLVSSLVFSIPAAKAEESGTQRYLAGYQDGYAAGFKAGFENAMGQLTNQATAPTVLQTETPELKEKTAPANGRVIYSPDEDMVAPLTIHTTGDDYYCFVLTKVGSSKRYMAVFGHGGETVDVNVPIGCYQIFYATGKIWYGLDNLFGPDTQYYHCDGFFAFRDEYDTYKGWELSLYPVTNGNLDSEKISAADFPK